MRLAGIISYVCNRFETCFHEFCAVETNYLFFMKAIMSIPSWGVKGSLCLWAVMTASVLWAQEHKEDGKTGTEKLRVGGTVRAKYEYQPDSGSGRFEVRNCRLAVTGRVVPMVGYKAEIDLSDEGTLRMLDAYVKLTPLKRLDFTIGQMRVPFAIDVHRSPHLQYFANRSFLAKQVGDVRDVGAMLAYTIPILSCPLTLEGGVFNGSGLTGQKHFWTAGYNYSLKASALIYDRVGITLSAQHIRPDHVGIMIWNAGAYWHSGRWHAEGEYLRKQYSEGAFSGVNAVDAFACYTYPVRKRLSGISFLGRYDYMDDHSKGVAGDDGRLHIDDARRHRATAGVTLHFGYKASVLDVRMNYEKYFYDSGVEPSVSERDKVVVEFMCHF